MKLRGLWWWIDRWRKSTAYTDMTLEEQGAYRNLLDDAALRGGPLPNDEHVLAKACGDPRCWRRVRAKVIAHFTLEADGWHNATLDSVLAKSTALAQERSLAGRAGASARWQAHGKPDDKLIAKTVTKPCHILETETDTESSSVVRSSSEKEEKESASPPLDRWLMQLQEDYPQQRVTFSYLTSSAFVDVFANDSRPPADVWAEMRANLENHKRGHEWRVKGMVPKLEKWLRDGLWKQQHDEHPVSTLVSEKTVRTLASGEQFVRGGSK